MNGKAYSAAVQSALDDTLTTHPDPTAENLLTKLSAHGLLVVEMPPGVLAHFGGIADAE